MRLYFFLLSCLFSVSLMAQPEQWTAEFDILGYELTPEFPGDSSQVEYFLEMMKKENGTSKKAFKDNIFLDFTESDNNSILRREVISLKDSLNVKFISNGSTVYFEKKFLKSKDNQGFDIQVLETKALDEKKFGWNLIWSKLIINNMTLEVIHTPDIPIFKLPGSSQLELQLGFLVVGYKTNLMGVVLNFGLTKFDTMQVDDALFSMDTTHFISKSEYDNNRFAFDAKSSKERGLNSGVNADIIQGFFEKGLIEKESYTYDKVVGSNYSIDKLSIFELLKRNQFKYIYATPEATIQFLDESNLLNPSLEKAILAIKPNWHEYEVSEIWSVLMLTALKSHFNDPDARAIIVDNFDHLFPYCQIETEKREQFLKGELDIQGLYESTDVLESTSSFDKVHKSNLLGILDSVFKSLLGNEMPDLAITENDKNIIISDGTWKHFLPVSELLDNVYDEESNEYVIGDSIQLGSDFYQKIFPVLNQLSADNDLQLFFGGIAADEIFNISWSINVERAIEVYPDSKLFDSKYYIQKFPKNEFSSEYLPISFSAKDFAGEREEFNILSVYWNRSSPEYDLVKSSLKKEFLDFLDANKKKLKIDTSWLRKYKKLVFESNILEPIDMAIGIPGVSLNPLEYDRQKPDYLLIENLTFQKAYPQLDSLFKDAIQPTNLKYFPDKHRVQFEVEGNIYESYYSFSAVALTLSSFLWKDDSQERQLYGIEFIHRTPYFLFFLTKQEKNELEKMLRVNFIALK